jgi:hypothetical protein
MKGRIEQEEVIVEYSGLEKRKIEKGGRVDK